MTRTIIFAKAPQPGLAKTRLIPALGEEGAARLARRMLDHTLACAVMAAIGPVELCTAPAMDSPAWNDVAVCQGVEITSQSEGDLGTRMAVAARRGLELNGSVLLIGTDCADMSVALLREAAAALRTNDAVLYPAVDGGYVLLGLNRFHSDLFTQMAWSTATVAQETLGRMNALACSVHVGAALHDVDEPGDLARLPPGWAGLIGTTKETEHSRNSYRLVWTPVAAFRRPENRCLRRHQPGSGMAQAIAGPHPSGGDDALPGTVTENGK